MPSRVGRADLLLLLDAPSLYFRAFYGVPETVTAPDGTPVNAVRGLLDFLAHLITGRRPTRAVACLDADWRPAFRVAAMPEYKAHRVAPDGGDGSPAALARQVPVIEQVLGAVGIACLGVAGFEADDVIAGLAHRAGCPVDVVTGDRDLLQLVRDDQPVRVVYTARGVAAAVVMDEAAVTARYGIPGRRYADFAVLRGDPSDGLRGVPGIGEKTAAALVHRFGSVEDVLSAATAGPDDGFPAGSRRRVLAAAEYLHRASAVVRARADLPLPRLADRLPPAPSRPAELVALSVRWGLDGPLNRLLAALRTAGAAAG